MENKYHVPKGSRLYSPKGVMGLFEQAVTAEHGDIAKVLNNKHKYKQLIELWHASFLALAINKWLNKKYFMYPADNPSNPGPPDVLFVNENDDDAFPVEITERHSSAEDIWRAKGKTNFDTCHLLIISRLNEKASNEKASNVDRFARSIQQHDWKFERIWLGIYTSSPFTWTFFPLFPPAQSGKLPQIQFSIKNKEDMTFFY